LLWMRLGLYLPDLPTGKSLDEMKRNFEMQLSDEFASHACAKCPRGKKGEVRVTRTNSAGSVSTNASQRGRSI
jgi:hypothetical protein